MIVSRVWAMPSPWTFTIKPIREFVGRWIDGAAVIVDPFAGKTKIGTHNNDLADGGMDAEDYCRKLIDDGVIADVVLFDPPYSPRQQREAYAAVGCERDGGGTRNAELYDRVRSPLTDLLRGGGVALSFGWRTSGMDFNWPVEELLIVEHGGAHNATLCTAQRKPIGLFGGAIR